MDKNPDFLPPKISTDGVWEIVVEKLYEVFNKDFKFYRPRHCGVRIFYDNRILANGNGKEEFFWHLISKDNKLTGTRDPHFPRARRLPWARPLMESGPRGEIKVFDYDHGPKDKGVRRYIWIEEYRYAIVLKEKKGKFNWLTAYYVSTNGHWDLANRYKNRVQKTATAL